MRLWSDMRDLSVFGRRALSEPMRGWNLPVLRVIADNALPEQQRDVPLCRLPFRFRTVDVIRLVEVIVFVGVFFLVTSTLFNARKDNP